MGYTMKKMRFLRGRSRDLVPRDASAEVETMDGLQKRDLKVGTIEGTRGGVGEPIELDEAEANGSIGEKVRPLDPCAWMGQKNFFSADGRILKAVISNN